MYMYSETSDNGPSERRTTSVQRINLITIPIDMYIRNFGEVDTSLLRTMDGQNAPKGQQFYLQEQGRIQDCINGNSFIINARKIFEAMPTYALTTPIFDQRPHVLSHFPAEIFEAMATFALTTPIF